MLWSGLKDAQTFDRGTFFQPGSYTLKIVNCLTKQTQKSGEAWIVEFEVLESSNPTAHAVGSKGSWFQKLSNVQVAFGAIKEFVNIACFIITKIIDIFGRCDETPQDIFFLDEFCIMPDV